jgi:hypothetical protein
MHEELNYMEKANVMYGCQPPSSDGSYGDNEATVDYTK